MLVNLVSHFNETGVGRHARFFADALAAHLSLAHRIKRIACDDAHALAAHVDRTAPRDQASIYFWGTFSRALAPRLARGPGRTVLWCVFESDRLAPPHVAAFHHFDEIWSPSHWGREVLIEHGLDPARIIVMPEGVDPNIFAPRKVAHDGLRLLMVGKYEKRKGIDMAIDAFQRAFMDDPRPIELWLKADHLVIPERAAELARRCVDAPRIRVVSFHGSDRDMAMLYNQCDAFLFPSRAEGFGLPLAEAIACDLPVLATNYSGHGEILSAIPGRFAPLPYHLVPIQDADYARFFGTVYGDTPFGQWAEIDGEAFATELRAFVDALPLWRDRAGEAGRIIRESFSWRSIARRAAVRLGLQ